ncbi:uncharacterized protein LOC128216219 [Mya arenaria]|uniref:uncharacterized protein LOC128216219 n=1 Tax=Mya arenaria TaxID=6604 RepID=UPI0022E0E9C5|nr:uncharacterized protein LOC128216219 [Mya arenaria]
MASKGSSICKGSDLIHDYSCSKCEENDLNTEAQHFCPQCEHYLCGKCVRIHGEYFKKHAVYERGEIQKWAGFSMDRCDKHGKELEVHCDDHQELCCSVCVALNHRLCSSISHLPDLAKGFLKTEEFKQLPVAVDKMRYRLDELKTNWTKDQASLKDSYKNILVEIKALRKEINQILDKLEKKTVEQLDSMMEDLKKSIKDDLETLGHMDDQLKTLIEKLQQTTGKNKDTIPYIGFRKCQSILSEANRFVQEIRVKEGMKFKSDESVLPFLRNLKRLGNVESVFSTYVYKVQSLSHYKVRIKKDKNNCSIKGVCGLANGEMVIADYNNIRVKLLNRQYAVIDHFDLPSTPQHLCHTTDNVIAVAVSDFSTINEVYFLTVTKGKLQSMRKFTTDHCCHSIAHHKGQLYVGSFDGLYLYSMDGRLLKTIYEALSCVRTVYNCAVSPTGKRLYVTNDYISKLLTFDKTGQVLFTVEYPDLKNPTGLFVSPSDHVFVCGRGSIAVVQVDKEGKQKVTTVASEADGICCPQSVWFSGQTSTLIVGNYEENDITVIKLC